jgi:hypothetical protein
MANMFPPGQQLPPVTDNRGPLVLRSTFIMAGIATPVLLARLYARKKRRGKLAWDDYLMAFSLVSIFPDRLSSLDF